MDGCQLAQCPQEATTNTHAPTIDHSNQETRKTYLGVVTRHLVCAPEGVYRGFSSIVMPFEQLEGLWNHSNMPNAPTKLLPTPMRLQSITATRKREKPIMVPSSTLGATHSDTLRFFVGVLVA